MQSQEKIGIDSQGNDVYIDWSHTNIAYHLLETPHLIRLIKEVLNTIVTNNKEQVVLERDLGRIIGETNLVETNETDEIVYAKRKGRDKYSRFVKHKKLVPTSWIVVVLRRIDNGYAVWTAMCGRLLPKEAYEPHSVFNKTHAMVYDESLMQLDSLTDHMPLE